MLGLFAILHRIKMDFANKHCFQSWEVSEFYFRWRINLNIISKYIKKIGE